MGVSLANVNSVLLPFTLGTPFDISIVEQAEVSGIGGVDGGGASVDNFVSFSLFEVDGVTPVLIEPTPELGTLGLAFGGGGAIVWPRRSSVLNNINRPSVM